MAESTKTITLVTGASSGIGLELAAQLAADSNNHVLLCSRSIEKREAALQNVFSRGLPGTVELLQLDVASEDSIKAAAQTVQQKHGRLDALVNNAGIGSLSVLTTEAFPLTYLTNAVGPYLTGEAFLPLLKKSITTPRILNVSSGGGSVTRRLANTHNQGMWGLPYSASKAALNLITVTQSVVYGQMGIKVFVFSPGFVESNLGPHNRVENGAQTTADGARPMLGILKGERDAEHGCFLVKDGQYPW